MRKNWVIAIGLWAGLMLLGWIVWVSRIERSLETSAREILHQHADARFFKDVTVDFDGQEAILSGRVHKPVMRGRAAQIVGEELGRTSGIGTALNPVTSVRNEIVVEPLPPGWLLLAMTGEKATLFGVTGSDDEKDLMTQTASKLLSKPGVEFKALVVVDDEIAGQAEGFDATLASLASALRSLGFESGVLSAVAGTEWQPVAREDAETLHTRLAAAGVSAAQWKDTFSPLLADAWQRLDDARAAAAEAARLAKLPPPHVVLAIKGSEVLLQGDVGTATLKTSLIESALKAYPALRVLDLIRVSKERRPVVDAAAMLGGFPAANGAGKDGLVAVAVPPYSWKSAPLSAESDVAALVRTTIPAGIEPHFVEADAKNVAQWFAAKSTPVSNSPVPPALTLAIFGDRVWLRGQVAEEATRTQILDAARRLYPNHLLVQYVRLNARCTPVAEALPTARSFPAAPAADAPGIVAFVLAGDAWRSADVSEVTFAPDGIAKAGIIPEGFPAAVADDEFSEALDALKSHWEKLKNDKPK